MRKIGVLTSGGDSPGMNSAVRAVVRFALNNNLTPYGVSSGYKGLVEGEIMEMKHHDVANIIGKGGTILGTARSMEFKTKAGQEKAVENLKKNGIEGLVIIGGDGSLTGAKILEENYGIKTIGIPGSIDNDIYGTDISLGADTALNTIVQSVDMINNTASSHGRTFIIEVMGRESGYLAIMSAIATGADYAIIPEVEPNMEEVINLFKKREEEGKNRNILILAEGAGSGYEFGKILQDAGAFDARITVLGHVQRGGSPTYFDRVLGTKMGVYAVESLIAGKSGAMTGLHGNVLNLIPYETIFANKHIVKDYIVNLLEFLN